MTDRHVLLTGGAGYLGSVLAERLLEAGCRVTVLDSLLFGSASLFHLCANPRFAFVRGDCRDEALLASLLAEADVIVPLAAVVGAPACDVDPWLARSVNVGAVELLVRLRRPDQLIVYPTTHSGYGARPDGELCTEETPLAPLSLYGRTKVEAEQLLSSQPNVIVLRLATVFGASPRLRLDLLLHRFVYAAVTDGYLVIFERDFRRSFVHVRDVADCFVHCLAHAEAMGGRAYNLGADVANVTKAELAELVQRHVPGFYLHFAEVGHDPDRRNYRVSSQRLREAGFEARRDLASGIPELLKACRMLGRQPQHNA